MLYEELKDRAERNGLRIIEKSFKSKHLKGICKGNKIGIRKELPISVKTCVLAEEMGHIATTTGNIIDQRNANNIKQEGRAHRWAHTQILPICHLYDAFKKGYRESYEMAEYLEVSEDFLKESLDHYNAKLGQNLFEHIESNEEPHMREKD